MLFSEFITTYSVSEDSQNGGCKECGIGKVVSDDGLCEDCYLDRREREFEITKAKGYDA